MLAARAVARLPTRRPKDRPKSLRMDVGDQDNLNGVELPIDSFPALLQLPLLPIPSFLTGQQFKKGVDICGLDTISFGKDPRQAARELGVTTVQQTCNFDATSFIRLLAKIGYGFAVAQAGPFPLEEVPVLPLILGSADDGSTWVGSADFQTEMERRGALHVMCLLPPLQSTADAHDKVLVVRIKLFAGSGATGYEVVVRRFSAD